MDTTQKAIEILQVTNDGDILHPFDLKLLEMAVNGFLSDAWLEKFNELHKRVMDGKYESPFASDFHGIEGLRINREGYVFWRGVEVEHYNIPWAFSDEAKGKAKALAARCKRYEDAGLKIGPFIVWEADPTVE